MNSVVLASKLRAEARRARRKLLRFNERGYRIGESNPAAILSDRDVELLLELRAEGFDYEWLAAKFECSKETVKSICIGRRRMQAIAKVRTA